MPPSARGSLATLILLALASLLPSPAAAHLSLLSSEPADGVHLTTVPSEIRLRFSEPVELAFTRLELLGPDGTPVELSEPGVAPGEPNVLVVRIEGSVAPGPHTIAWRTTSADGHPVRGRIGFTVDEEAEGLAAATAEQPPADDSPVHHDPALFPEGHGFTAGSPGYVVVRWLTFVGLLGVIGIVAFQLLVLGLVRRGREPEGILLLGLTRGRSALLGIAFSLLLVGAVLARLYAQSVALHGAGEAIDGAAISAILTRTTWGTGWLLQAVASVVVLVGFVLAWHRTPEPPLPVNRRSGHSGDSPLHAGDSGRGGAGYGTVAASAGVATDPAVERDPALHGSTESRGGAGMNLGWALAAIGAVVLAFTPALAGHAVATPARTWLAVLSDGIHVLGAGGWLGSLLAVVAVGIPAAMRLGPARRGPAVAAMVNAFSPTALFFAAVVTATGVLSATFHMGAFADLWQSDYGRTLLLKIGVLSLLFGTGAYNWRRVRPSLGDDAGGHRLRRSASVELAVGVVVLLVTAVLVATPPPLDPEPAADHTLTAPS
jgi:copper transport protein